MFLMLVANSIRRFGQQPWLGELLGEDSKASASAASASASKRSSVASSERSVEDTKNKDAQALSEAGRIMAHVFKRYPSDTQ